MPRATAGRLHANGWASIDLMGGATIYLEPLKARAVSGPPWIIRAAKRAGWQIEYAGWANGFPQAVSLQSDAPTAMVDLTAGLSQIETNKDLDAAAFTVTVSAGAEPITLDELRENGPLGS
jgi:hypothetical protein